MAWIDDRIWCHPKFTDLTPSAAWVYVKALAYSAGMSTGGILSQAQQALIGSNAKTRDALVAAGLWHTVGDTIRIHDWDDHNGKRDDRRRKDRERKRAARVRGKSADTSADVSAESPPRNSRGRPRAEGSEGSEGSTKAFNGPRFQIPKNTLKDIP